MASDGFQWDDDTRRIFIGYTKTDDEVWLSGQINFNKGNRSTVKIKTVLYKGNKSKDVIGEKDLDLSRMNNGIPSHKGWRDAVKDIWMKRFEEWVSHQTKIKLEDSTTPSVGRRGRREPAEAATESSIFDDDSKAFFDLDRDLPKATLERISKHFARGLGLNVAPPVEVIKSLREFRRVFGDRVNPKICSDWVQFLIDTNQQVVAPTSEAKEKSTPSASASMPTSQPQHDPAATPSAPTSRPTTSPKASSEASLSPVPLRSRAVTLGKRKRTISEERPWERPGHFRYSKPSFWYESVTGEIRLKRPAGVNNNNMTAEMLEKWKSVRQRLLS